MRTRNFYPPYQLAAVARLLGTHGKPSPILVKLMALHCARIMPTIRYAVAQNNNHGTSEAAALFIGGAWLMAQAENGPLRKDAQTLARWRSPMARRPGRDPYCGGRQLFPVLAELPPGSRRHPLPGRTLARRTKEALSG